MRTDEILNPGLYFALIIVGWIVGVALSMVSFVFFWVYSVVIAFVVYKMINRMNLHSQREAALRGTIIQYFRDKASADPSVGQKISAQIATMESIQYDAQNQEREQNAILWAILSVIIPFLFLYPLYFLTKYSSGHDRRWHAFTQQAQYAGQQMGMSIVLPSWRILPDRSFFLYLILTIVTFGLFGIYWFYVLLKDLNEHFPVQWQFEDQFVREMR
jgi:hypothetical protein